MDKYFFNLYRNLYLRKYIFSIIKQENRSLEYIPYNYYNFPLKLICSTKNQELLLQRFNQYLEKATFQYENVFGRNKSQEYFTEYIDFDFNISIYCDLLKWRELDLNLFIRIYNEFKTQILLFKKQTPFLYSHLPYDLVVKSGNYPLFLFFLEKNEPIQSEFNFLKYLADCDSIDLIQYFYSNGYLSRLNEKSIVEGFTKIFSESKSIYYPFISQWFNSNSKDQESLKILERISGKVLNVALRSNQYDFVKLVLKINSNYNYDLLPRRNSVRYNSLFSINLITYPLNSVEYNQFFFFNNFFRINLSIEIIHCIYQSYPDLFFKYLYQEPIILQNYDVSKFLLENFSNIEIAPNSFKNAISVYKNLDIVKLIAKHRPNAVFIDIDYFNTTYEIIQYLFETFPNQHFCDHFIHNGFNGDIRIVKYLDKLSKKYPDRIIFSKKSIDNAARFGYLDIVKYLYTNRKEGFSVDAISSASSGYHYSTLEFLFRELPKYEINYLLLFSPKSLVVQYPTNFKKRKKFMAIKSLWDKQRLLHCSENSQHAFFSKYAREADLSMDYFYHHPETLSMSMEKLVYKAIVFHNIPLFNKIQKVNPKLVHNSFKKKAFKSAIIQYLVKVNSVSLLKFLFKNGLLNDAKFMMMTACVENNSFLILDYLFQRGPEMSIFFNTFQKPLSFVETRHQYDINYFFIELIYNCFSLKNFTPLYYLMLLKFKPNLNLNFNCKRFESMLNRLKEILYDRLNIKTKTINSVETLAVCMQQNNNNTSNNISSASKLLINQVLSYLLESTILEQLLVEDHDHSKDVFTSNTLQSLVFTFE
ncbi:hypothetical protein CYY_003364 [Polysphondylium violaceum]|uniref:Ankyrin repeat-containing protein n=1 Tax=Polysphondylium violaceum TaxID=133409 RepID=A0A8J4PXU3_9MYCE|nr:hypothetical protein CYY_003364 [Polysphondylium violaceum]